MPTTFDDLIPNSEKNAVSQKASAITSSGNITDFSDLIPQKSGGSEVVKSLARGGLNVISGIVSKAGQIGARRPASQAGFGIGFSPALKTPETTEDEKALKSTLDNLSTEIYKEGQAESLQAKPGAGRFEKFFTQTLPEIVPYMAATAIGTVAGGPTGGFLVGSAVEGNNHYRQAKDDMLTKGYSEEDAERIASNEGEIVGMVNGMIETAQVSGVIKLAKGTGAKALKQLVTSRTLQRAGSALGKLSLVEAQLFAQEALEEFSQSATSQGVGVIGHDGSFSLTEAGNDALVGGTVGAVLGLGGSIPGAVLTKDKSITTEQAASAVGTVVENGFDVYPELSSPEKANEFADLLSDMAQQQGKNVQIKVDGNTVRAREIPEDEVEGLTPDAVETPVTTTEPIEAAPLSVDTEPEIVAETEAEPSETAQEEAAAVVETGAVEPKVIDTRGGKAGFHGTSEEIKSLDNSAYSTLNIFGQGLYTTDATDVAIGYTKKGKGKSPTIYRVDEKNPNLKFLDMEQDISPDLKDKLNDVIDDGLPKFGDKDVDGKVITSLRQLKDEIRDVSESEGFSADSIQEIFDSMRVHIEAAGFNGVSHIGSPAGGKYDPHKVKIYFNPKDDVELVKVDQLDLTEKPPTKPKEPAKSVAAKPTPKKPVTKSKTTTKPKPKSRPIKAVEATEEAEEFTMTQFEADPTTETKAKGEPGFAGVASRPGGISQKPWLTQDKVNSPDTAIDDFFGRTKKPPVRRKASKLLTTIKQGLGERFITSFKTRGHENSALARDMVRTIPEELRSKTDKALADMQEILDGGGVANALDHAGLDLLRRKVFIQDMLEEAKIDRSVPGDLTEKQLQTENDRIDKLLSQVPSVQRAFTARQNLWKTVSEDLFKRGVIDETAKNNRAYVRHFVLAHAERGPSRVSVKKKKLAEPWRAYKKRRTGSKKDISTDYLSVELTALSQIYRDNAIEDMANDIGKTYDKRVDFRKEAKENVEKEIGDDKLESGEKTKLVDKEIEKIAAERDYREWHYKRPNLVYMARTVPESQMAALLENSAEDAGETLNIPKAMIRQALVLGGKRKGMLLPTWLADQLDDLPVNKRSPYVVASFTRPFIQAWKRWILRVNSFRYNFRNSLGDIERLNAAGQTAAIKKIPEAMKALVTKEGELYQQAQKFGVVGSSLWHEMGDPSRLKQFERFKDIGKQKNFKAATKAVFGAPLRAVQRVGQFEQDLTQVREDILRMAVFMSNMEKLEAGKPVRHWAGDLADIQEIAKTSKARAAAKISRETLVDYGDFTPFEDDVLRNGLLPFYSYMKKNATFWPRAFKNAAQEGTTGKTASAAAAIASTHVGAWLVRVMGLYAFGMLWNYRDEDSETKEQSMPFWLRSMPHLNVEGRTLWGQTAMSDFGEWFDHQELAGLNWRREAGFIDNKKAAVEAAGIIARAPLNKVVQSLNPFLKGTFTAISGQEIYPDVFNPRFVASPASKKSLARGFIGILGTDFKKFYESAKGERKLEDSLSAYFAGWWTRPIDADTLIEQVIRTKQFTTLKSDSKTTGRLAGGPKKGKEKDFQAANIQAEALVKIRDKEKQSKGE